jgi:hypothetical protein
MNTQISRAIQIPPPCGAELPDSVQLVIVLVAVSARTAPPVEAAVFALSSQLWSTRLALLYTPPPLPEVFPDKVQLVSVAEAPALFRTPPPTNCALLGVLFPERVQFVKVALLLLVLLKPPPSAFDVVFVDMIVFNINSVPPLSLLIPPPKLAVAVFPETVQVVMVNAPP